MKKYEYLYCVFTNNLRSGVQFVCAVPTLRQALREKEYLQHIFGCCDVVKKRFLKGTTTPLTKSICNNYKYSEYDL